jgi:hypothetical protein
VRSAVGRWFFAAGLASRVRFHARSFLASAIGGGLIAFALTYPKTCDYSTVLSGGSVQCENVLGRPVWGKGDPATASFFVTPVAGARRGPEARR